ncbi:hypothetical protein A4H97_03355 [Niastella yeongjuensis]|uniref:SMODS and SLOG-associating 2TM effector domain-containing protein n=1 Tax=Niastella yeongjuensis TaxID=354355 RepID=A0A1V9EXM9_9BACT|nr:DUF4231 domain-containing protein [Niastella yeongjuensis]OQP50876.1 hypothetical protein A4H97_03355 [Niastella yeongjuensis]SEN13569.1 Protein of unknown function [Niastella yeongjuensis]
MRKFRKLINGWLEETNEVINALPLDDVKKKQLGTDWIKSIAMMEHLTKTNYLRYNLLNLTAIIAGAIIPVVLSLDILKENGWATTIGSILGVLVSLSISINHSYRFNDRWRHFRFIAESLKIEGNRFLALSDGYSGFDNHNGGAFKKFMGNIAKIKEEQIHTYIQKILKEEQKPDDKKDPKHDHTGDASSVNLSVASKTADGAPA